MLNIKLKKTVKDIASLNKTRLNNKSAFNIKVKNEQLHAIISDILFKAIKKGSCDVIRQIVTNDHIKAELVRDENGLNVLQYSVINSDNELFRILYSYYEDIRCYFNDIPQLFLLILNRKNYELINIFLNESKLCKKLTKENISLLIYSLVQEDRDILLNFVLQNEYVNEMVDGRCIQSILIYLISNEKNDKFQKLCSNEKLFSKCDEGHIKNLVALSIMNKNIKALEIMIGNEKVLTIILHDDQILKNTVLFTYINRNIKILTTIFQHRFEANSQFFQIKGDGIPIFEDSL